MSGRSAADGVRRGKLRVEDVPNDPSAPVISDAWQQDSALCAAWATFQPT